MIFRFKSYQKKSAHGKKEIDSEISPIHSITV